MTNPLVRAQAADESACKPGSGGADALTCRDPREWLADLRVSLAALLIVLREFPGFYGLVTAWRRPDELQPGRLAQLLAPYVRTTPGGPNG